MAVVRGLLARAEPVSSNPRLYGAAVSQNPFTNPRDANLAAAWEHGTAIGKRRERILSVLLIIFVGIAVAGWWFA